MSDPHDSEQVKAHQVLVQFPPEIWGSITALVSGEQIGRLKMTGSKRLWSQLCQTRAVESIKLGKDYLVFKRWPAFLNELPQVRELSIRNSCDEWWRSWYPTLDLVPKTLRKLTIKLPTDNTSFFFVEKGGTALYLTEHVPLLEVLRLNFAWSLANPWMAHTPATLSSLHFSGYDGSIPVPASLTNLSIYQSVTGQLKLPASLVHLEHRFGETPPFLSDPLPTSLQTMIIGIPVGLETLNAVPPSVTSLDMAVLFPTFTTLPTPIFPPCLTCLRARHVPSTFWSQLPSTVKTLQLRIIESNDLVLRELKSGISVKTIPIEYLPKSITSLTLSRLASAGPVYIVAPSEYSSTTHEALPLFPPSLTDLSLGHGTISYGIISLEAAKQIPTSLLKLSMQCLYPEMCKFLPKRLLKLDSKRVIGDLNIVGLLPNSLTEIELEFKDYRDPANPYESSIIEQDAISKATQEEVLQMIQDFWKRDVCFPNLRKLTLLSSKIASLEAFFSPQAKLNSVESLLLGGLNNWDPSKIVFPSHLLALSTREEDKPSEKSYFSAELIQRLPRSIEDLVINVSSDDSSLQYLPPNLKLITINYAPNLTADCVRYLPKRLEMVRIEKEFDHNTPALLPPLTLSLTKGTTFFGTNLIIRNGKVPSWIEQE